MHRERQTRPQTRDPRADDSLDVELEAFLEELDAADTSQIEALTADDADRVLAGAA